MVNKGEDATYDLLCLAVVPSDAGDGRGITVYRFLAETFSERRDSLTYYPSVILVSKYIVYICIGDMCLSVHRGALSVFMTLVFG